MLDGKRGATEREVAFQRLVPDTRSDNAEAAIDERYRSLEVQRLRRSTDADGRACVARHVVNLVRDEQSERQGHAVALQPQVDLALWQRKLHTW